MVALTFPYKRTVHVRKDICGGMGSEYSHSEVQETELTVVVPRDDDYWRNAARNYVEQYSGNIRDKAFLYTGPIRVTPVSAILHETHRLD